MATKKRKVFSIDEKAATIARLESGDSNVTIFNEYNLSHSTVTTIWRNQDKIKAAFDDNLLNKRKMRQSVHKDVEIASLQWFKDMRSEGIPINGPLLQQKAEEFCLLQQKAEEFCRLLNKENYKRVTSVIILWLEKFLVKAKVLILNLQMIG
ncbi:Tc5 transposase DNA-binding domain [Popillia japonica]|uniref:Tc5 transposase DNA-binding domain n=1 Tax=Popillia japonica TaxID=7064 RepID=A0AAW1K3M4_POPJA